MENEAAFAVDIVGNVIHVKLRGLWTIQADLAYLTLLGEKIQTMRGNSWAIYVDMRGWIMPLSVYDSEFSSKIQLDRRNQKAECWVMDDFKQGEMLLHFLEKSGVPFKRFLDFKSAQQWMVGYGFKIQEAD